mgnify:CR=1 FL=1
MKIVIFTPGLVTGGAEIMAVRLAVYLRKLDKDVEVVSLSKDANDINEKRLLESNIKVNFIDSTSSSKVKRLINTWRTLSKLKPDVIHSHISGTIYAIPWVLFHKVKLVHTIHTKPDVEFPKYILKIFKFLCKINKLTLVAVSKENQMIAQKYYKLSESKIKYVNNPVEVSSYYKNECRDDNLFTFINVSRQDINKNQILMIRAMNIISNKFDNIKLILVGDGNQHIVLKEETIKLGLEDKICLVGERSDVEHFLSNADVYVSTSHREGLPLSMLEAMASRLPVISTNVGGIPDIVKDNGVLIDDDNLDQLVKAMEFMIKNNHYLKKYGEESLKIATSFDAKTCAMKYIDIYNKK